MSVVSGKDGKIMIGETSLAEITKWTFNPTANVGAWHGSGGGGYKKRVAGVKDGSGDIEFKVDESDMIYDTIPEGTSVTLLLYRDGTNYFSVPAIITGIDFEVDIDDGEPNSGSASFETNGAWTDNP